MNNIITIDRQFGSGGHEIGKRLAKELNIPFYDKEILKLTAENSRFAEEYIRKMDERKPGFLNIGSPSIVSSDGMINQFYSLPVNDQVFLETGKVLRNIASQGPCVIVGRCSDFILRDMGSINIFILADLKVRTERKLALEENQGMSFDEMQKKIEKTDKNRGRYYEYYTHERWGVSRRYNLCVDTTAVGIDGAVQVIAKYIEECGKHSIVPGK